MATLFAILLFVTAVFLVVLVLIQRGKGGGLAGALGGMGGQSAFGTKAGDLFTKITIGVASFWIVLCLITVKVLGVGGEGLVDRGIGAGGQSPSVTAPPTTDKDKGATKGATTPAPAKTTPEKK